VVDIRLYGEGVMGFGSPIHWILLLVIWAAWMVPLDRLLGRIGWSRAWAAVALFPPLAIILLWFIAFGPWRTPEAKALRDTFR
jgi:hypothetical protein